ncbi:phosphatidylinositol phosphodiesterase, partial [Bacillus thuringiensis]
MNKIKMRNFFKISILTCITLASLSTPSTILADSHPGYSYESNIGYQNPSWMSKIEGSTKISEISIPGTHGTMALHGASFLDENLTRNQT